MGEKADNMNHQHDTIAVDTIYSAAKQTSYRSFGINIKIRWCLLLGGKVTCGFQSESIVLTVFVLTTVCGEPLLLSTVGRKDIEVQEFILIWQLG